MNERVDARKPERSGVTPEVLDASFVTLQDEFRARRTTILEGAGAKESLEVEVKDEDNSFVTIMDKTVEQELCEVLQRQFPDLPVFGEEGGYTLAELEKTDAFWLLDPIDGTSAYIKGEPTFTCMAMCVERNVETGQLEVTRSLIYDPTTNTMFTAQKGQGAYKTVFDDNGDQASKTRIDLRQQSLPDQPVVMCKGALMPQIASIFESEDVACIPAPSGGGYRYTQVLEGKIAMGCQIHGGGKIHDYAGGRLLIEEAGGVIIPVLADENTWDNGVSSVACHPALEETVRSLIPQLRELEKQKP